MIKVFISSPYTLGDRITNVERQMQCAHELIEEGFNPYVPLLNHYMEVYKHQEEQVWLKLDIEWLKTCDALLRLPGISNGADKEVMFAMKNEIPVFYDIISLISYYKSK